MKKRTSHYHIYFCLTVIFFLSCDYTLSTPDIRDLELIESFPLEINDPSGLTLDISGDFLWTVSDDSEGHIYKISFTGSILDVITGFEGDDLEGITINPEDGTLWVADEKLRQIIQVTTEGEVLRSIDIPTDITNPNDGLEGIAWNPKNNHILILNEKNPRQFIELDTDFKLVHSKIIDFYPPFNITDASGLFYTPEENELWIVSDETKKIVVTDEELNPLRVYRLPVDKFEGIALDVEKKRLYLVNDRLNSLYVFKLPD